MIPLRAVVHRAPLGTLAAVAAIGGLATGVRAATASDIGELLAWLRLAAVMLAAAAATCLSDPPEVFTATTPYGRLRRRAAAIATTAVACALLMLMVVALASILSPDSVSIPVGGLLIELVAMASVGWAAAAMLVSIRGHDRARVESAISVVLLAAVTLGSPRLMHLLWVGPGSEWTVSHQRWATIAVVALAISWFMSRDPMARFGGGRNG